MGARLPWQSPNVAGNPLHLDTCRGCFGPTGFEHRAREVHANDLASPECNRYGPERRRASLERGRRQRFRFPGVQSVWSGAPIHSPARAPGPRPLSPPPDRTAPKLRAELPVHLRRKGPRRRSEIAGRKAQVRCKAGTHPCRRTPRDRMAAGSSCLAEKPV